MYCIIAMPRTVSTSVFYWLNYSLGHTVRTPMVYFRKNWSGTTEIFENVPEHKVQKVFNEILDEVPLPVVKLLAYSQSAIRLFLECPLYKKIVILPSDLKKVVLKNEIAVTTMDWSGLESERIERRAPYLGQIEIPVERFDHYYQLYAEMQEYAKIANLVVTDQQLIADPNANLLEPLGLPRLYNEELRGHYDKHSMDDRAMLKDPKLFDAQWEQYAVQY